MHLRKEIIGFIEDVFLIAFIVILFLSLMTYFPGSIEERSRSLFMLYSNYFLLFVFILIMLFFNFKVNKASNYLIKKLYILFRASYVIVISATLFTNLTYASYRIQPWYYIAFSIVLVFTFSITFVLLYYALYTSELLKNIEKNLKMVATIADNLQHDLGNLLQVPLFVLETMEKNINISFAQHRERLLYLINERQNINSQLISSTESMLIDINAKERPDFVLSKDIKDPVTAFYLPFDLEYGKIQNNKRKLLISFIIGSFFLIFILFDSLIYSIIIIILIYIVCSFELYMFLLLYKSPNIEFEYNFFLIGIITIIVTGVLKVMTEVYLSIMQLDIQNAISTIIYGIGILFIFFGLHLLNNKLIKYEQIQKKSFENYNSCTKSLLGSIGSLLKLIKDIEGIIITTNSKKIMDFLDLIKDSIVRTENLYKYISEEYLKALSEIQNIPFNETLLIKTIK